MHADGKEIGFDLKQMERIENMETKQSKELDSKHVFKRNETFSTNSTIIGYFVVSKKI